MCTCVCVCMHVHAHKWYCMQNVYILCETMKGHMFIWQTDNHPFMQKRISALYLIFKSSKHEQEKYQSKVCIAITITKMTYFKYLVKANGIIVPLPADEPETHTHTHAHTHTHTHTHTVALPSCKKDDHIKQMVKLHESQEQAYSSALPGPMCILRGSECLCAIWACAVQLPICNGHFTFPGPC